MEKLEKSEEYQGVERLCQTENDALYLVKLFRLSNEHEVYNLFVLFRFGVLY